MGVVLRVEFGTLHSDAWKHSGSPTWKLFKSPPFGFVWRLHYIGIADLIIADGD